MPIKIPRPGTVAQPGNTALRVSLGVAQQESAALQGLAGSIAGVGDTFLRIGQEIERADDLKKQSEIELSVHEAQGQYLQSLENNFEENTWVPGADSVMQGIREQAASMDMSPGARRQMDMKLDKAEATFKLKVGTAAARQINARAKEAGLLAAEVAIQNNDLAGYESKIDEMAGTVISPEQAAKLKNDGARKIAKNRVFESVLEDPSSTKEALKSGTFDNQLSTSDKASLIYRATVEENRNARDFYDDLSLGLLQDKIPSEDQVTQWAEEGSLTASQASSLLSRVRAANPPEFDSAKYMGLSKRIASYDPNLDNEAKTGLTDLMGDVLASGFTGGALTKLKTRLENHMLGDTAAGTVPARVRSEAIDVVDWYAEQGAFGLTTDADGKPIPESKKSSDDMRARIIDELEVFLTRNPDVSHEEARAAADRIIRPKLDQFGADSILGVEDVIEAQEDDLERTGLELPQLGRQPSDILFNG